jgi:glycosyltransferase involved in cell wall biosynthesis
LSNSAKLVANRPLIAQGLYSFRIGGSERVGAQLAIEYVARGYQVVCFAFHGTTGPFRDQLESQGIECVDLNYLTRMPIVRRATYQLELYRFLRRRGVRALHVHHAMALTLCGIPARCAGIRHVVMSEHAIFQLEEQPDYRRSSARYCRYATAITGVHAGITDYFHERMGVPANRLHVIPNGVPDFTRDALARIRVRKALGVDDSTFVCLYVGRLEAVKDLGTLLKAVGRLSESVRRTIRVFLAGEGSERAALEALLRSLNLEGTVTFLGARSDIHELLNMADAFVMTSRTEGLPMALIEAMAAGLPCVATAVGGIPAVLSSDAGIVVPPDNPDAVAQALMQLAGDEFLRRQFAERAVRKVRSQYGLEPVVTAYLELLGLPAHWSPGQ